MKNECVIKETLGAVVMQEAQIERLVERCREAQAERPRLEQCGGTESTKSKRIILFKKSLVSVAVVCVLLFAAGAATVYAVVSRSFLDKYKGSQEDFAYVSQLISGEAQTVCINGLQFTIEDYVFEKNVGEGHFVLKITREDGTKPEAEADKKLQMTLPKGGQALYLDGLSYVILFEEIGTEQKLPEICESSGLSKEEAWELAQNVSYQIEGKEFADAICYYVSFRAKEENGLALYVLQTDAFSVEDLEAIRESDEGLFLTEAVSEAVTFTHGQLTVILNPFTLQLIWEGELPVPTYLKKSGEAPIETVTLVKKDGTELAVIEDFMPVAENLKWDSGRHSKDYRTGEAYNEENYQMISLLNIQEVDYLLINGEKVTVE